MTTRWFGIPNRETRRSFNGKAYRDSPKQQNWKQQRMKTKKTKKNKGEREMDKVYIDNSQRSEVVELPRFGEVKLIVKEGKVVQYYATESHVLDKKQSEK